CPAGHDHRRVRALRSGSHRRAAAAALDGGRRPGPAAGGGAAGGTGRLRRCRVLGRQGRSGRGGHPGGGGGGGTRGRRGRRAPRAAGRRHCSGGHASRPLGPRRAPAHRRGPQGRGGTGQGAPGAVISVIIPAYNEAGPLPATVAALRGLPEVDEIVVVDDGSTDETAAVAEGLGCRVVRLVRNRGKGKALTAGVRAAKGDVLVFLDADLGASAAEARRLLAPLLAGEADMVIGRFPEAQRPGGLGMVKALARAGVRWLGGLAVAAPLS